MVRDGELVAGELRIDGRERGFTVRLSRAAPPGRAVPLALVLHGHHPDAGWTMREWTTFDRQMGEHPAVLRLLEVNGHVVVEEATTDVIALYNALGHDEPWRDPDFIDKIMALQRQRQNSIRPAEALFCDQGFIQPTAARRISFEDSLVFEHLHEQTYRDLGFLLVEVPPAR
jgi:predicted ATPase